MAQLIEIQSRLGRQERPHCQFCGRELSAIERWCNCAKMRFAHAMFLAGQIRREQRARIISGIRNG
jgi:predicted amidophosphoribosyltransferase